jgi:hypothetical protein
MSAKERIQRLLIVIGNYVAGNISTEELVIELRHQADKLQQEVDRERDA